MEVSEFLASELIRATKEKIRWEKGCLSKRKLSKKHAKLVAKKYKSRGVKLTSYRCFNCGFWHMTSRIEGEP